MPELFRRMQAMGYPIQSTDQLRQWRHNYYGRIPSPEYCMGIHLATDGKVSLKELRPDDWQRIWPEYHGKKHATPGNGNRKIKEDRMATV